VDTYNPNKLTSPPKKVDISLRQLADFDQTGGSIDRVDNVRDNQVLVSLSKLNRPKTFSFRYISDILIGGNGVTISTDKDGITTISNSGVRKIIAGTNITISPVTGIGDVTVNAATNLNIYNADGSLTGARTLTLNSNPLTIAGTSSSRFYANGNVAIGTTTDAGFKLDVNGTARIINDALVNEITVGRGGGAGIGNTAIGKSALQNNLIGTGNTAVGNNSLLANKGTDNTAVGNGALQSNVIGVTNTAVGVAALTSNTVNNNTAVGGYALYLTTTGGQNTAVGTNALSTNSTGSNSVAIGYNALNLNTTTSQNAAVGHSALQNNRAGSNTALGFGAGYNGGTNANTTGANNIFIGANSIGVSATESNRTWIGNTSTTTTWLGGSLLLGTTTDVASSKLTIESTTQGFLPPRMTTTEKNAISSPASGLIVYDSTLNALNFYNGSSWSSGGGGGSSSLTVGTTPIVSGTVGRVLFEGTGNVLQESANLFWDNTNGRLGIKTNTPLGILHLKEVGQTTRFLIDGDAGQSKIITYRTNGLQRFGLYVNNIAESGSNAGSDFAIRAYNDAGVLLSTPLYIKRSSGNVLINTTTDSGFKVDVNGTARVNNTLTISASTPANFVPLVIGNTNSSPSSRCTINLVNNLGDLGTITSFSSTWVGSGTDDAANTLRFSGLGSGGIAIRASASSIRLYTGSTERLQVTTTGNLLIGTTIDAGFKLDVNGNTRVQGRQSITSDTSVTTQTSSVIQATTTNANLVLTPNGTGSILASIPDGTAVGGNARGTNSVDLQMTRAAANQIAQGNNSTITGGQSNRIIVGGSFIGGGSTNFINSTNTPGMVIVGGNGNTILQNDQGGTPNFIGGGTSNTAQGGNSLVVGGKSNTAGGYNIDNVVIGGGQSNVASQTNSIIPGGISNTASGVGSVVIGGGSNISSGTFSFSSGVYSRALSNYSVASGYGGVTSFPGQFAMSSFGPYFGLLGNNGSSYQFSDLLCYNLLNNLTTGQTLVLYPGNSSSNLLLPAYVNKVWHVTAKYTMYVATKVGTADLINNGDTLFGTVSFGYRSGVGAFITSTFAENKVSNNVNINTALFTFSVGASNELKLTFTAPTFTGGGELRIRCNVKLELVETIQGIGGY
jgi:hypothetical protein